MEAHSLMTSLVIMMLMSSVVSVKLEKCKEVFDSFMPCMGFVEGIFRQPSPECCKGVNHLNNIVTLTGSSREKEKEIERVCECVEIMGRAEHLPFLADSIDELPLLCSLHLSFPVSVAMDCSQFGNIRVSTPNNKKN